jgi:hypothetical protein
VLELLHEAESIATCLTTEAHKTTGAREHRHVRPAPVGVERTSADKCGPGAMQLNTILADHVGDWVLLAQTIGINSWR